MGGVGKKMLAQRRKRFLLPSSVPAVHKLAGWRLVRDQPVVEEVWAVGPGYQLELKCADQSAQIKGCPGEWNRRCWTPLRPLYRRRGGVGRGDINFFSTRTNQSFMGGGDPAFF